MADERPEKSIEETEQGVIDKLEQRRLELEKRWRWWLATIPAALFGLLIQRGPVSSPVQWLQWVDSASITLAAVASALGIFSAIAETKQLGDDAHVIRVMSDENSDKADMRSAMDKSKATRSTYLGVLIGFWVSLVLAVSTQLGVYLSSAYFASANAAENAPTPCLIG